ncbi:MAG: hypothetical protein QOE03_1375 [Micromonosporaceae bacterium]|nr:hypothetical protein [Micromonosporaceae bacterium]
MTQLPQQGRSITETHSSDPTIPLLDCITNLFHEMELHHQRQYEHRVRALERLLDAKLITLRTVVDSHAEKAVLALTAADKAISKAEAATERRFESVNEFRQTLSDQTRTFISKVEFEAVRDTFGTRIADLSSRLDKTEGKAVGLNAGWIYLLGALSAASTIASVIIATYLRTH